MIVLVAKHAAVYNKIGPATQSVTFGTWPTAVRGDSYKARKHIAEGNRLLRERNVDRVKFMEIICGVISKTGVNSVLPGKVSDADLDLFHVAVTHAVEVDVPEAVNIGPGAPNSSVSIDVNSGRVVVESTFEDPSDVTEDIKKMFFAACGDFKMGHYEHLTDVPLSFVTPVPRLLPLREVEQPEHHVVAQIVDPFVVLVRSRQTSDPCPRTRNNCHKLDPRIKIVECADTAPQSLQHVVDTNYEELVRGSPGQAEAHEHECEMGHKYFSRIGVAVTHPLAHPDPEIDVHPDGSGTVTISFDPAITDRNLAFLFDVLDHHSQFKRQHNVQRDENRVSVSIHAATEDLIVDGHVDDDRIRSHVCVISRHTGRIVLHDSAALNHGVACDDADTTHAIDIFNDDQHGMSSLIEIVLMRLPLGVDLSPQPPGPTTDRNAVD